MHLTTTPKSFTSHLHKAAMIFNFLGDLKHLDKKESLAEIRRKAQENTAKEIINNTK